jgi:hypothetical protein
MSVAKKRVLIHLGVLAVVAVAGWVLLAWLLGPTNIITMDQFAKVGEGMTETEIVELLGPGSESSGRFRLKQRHEMVGMAFVSDRQMSSFRKWQTNEGTTISITFDRDGKVAMMSHSELTESWLDKIRRWFRLSS